MLKIDCNQISVIVKKKKQGSYLIFFGGSHVTVLTSVSEPAIYLTGNLYRQLFRTKPTYKLTSSDITGSFVLLLTPYSCDSKIKHFYSKLEHRNIQSLPVQ